MFKLGSLFALLIDVPRHHRFFPITALCWAVCCVLSARSALAERMLMDGEVSFGSGLEGGNVADEGVIWKRARFRATAGAEFRNDEFPKGIWAFRAFSELERSGSLGASVRYGRALSPRLSGYLAVTGTVVPETLLGAGVSLKLKLLKGEGTNLFIESSFYALPLGSDLPSSALLFWSLLSMGLQTSL